MATKKPVRRAAKRSAAKRTARRPARRALKRTPRAVAKKAAAKKVAGKLRLSMMTGSYEIVRALKEGEVKPKGIDLVIGGFPGTGAIHDRVAEGKACDINEFNGGHYIMQKALGRDDITALPVFLHRRFRHGFIYVNKAKVKEPKDLIGKRIGSVSLGPAANYWMRGYLDELGVPHRSITWVIDRSDDQDRNAPKDLKIEMAPKGRRTYDMLLTGEIEGALSPSITRMIGEGDPRVGRLFPNYEEVEADYYRRTGIFPIMHVTTVPTRIVEKHPWVVESLTHAFEAAKQLAYKRLLNPRVVPFAWYRTYWEQERAMLGPDPWEYGLSARNRKNYDTLVGYVHAQLLTGRPRPRLEDLFAKEAFELALPLPRFHELDYAAEGGGRG
jgi:4,5-dihydroxyphthalate decarboxylase